MQQFNEIYNIQSEDLSKFLKDIQKWNLYILFYVNKVAFTGYITNVETQRGCLGDNNNLQIIIRFTNDDRVFSGTLKQKKYKIKGDINLWATNIPVYIDLYEIPIN